MQYEVTKIVSRLNLTRTWMLVNQVTSSGTRVLKSFTWEFVVWYSVSPGQTPRYSIRLRWEPAQRVIPISPREVFDYPKSEIMSCC